MGKRKVFLRLPIYEPLENNRIIITNASAIVVQSAWRRFLDRRLYIKKRRAALVLQHAFRGWQLRLRFILMRRAAVVIQCHLRGMFAREVAVALRELRRVEAQAKQREKERIIAQEAEEKQREKERFLAQEAAEAVEAAETLEEVSSISDQVIFSNLSMYEIT